MRTRFAPAPTGWLHLGHVLNAEVVWDEAARRGAAVVLRIEDHDRERARAVYEQGILDDLDWLGFVPDVFPTDAFRAGRCAGRQSDRAAVYSAALDTLRARAPVYGCDCSRQRTAHLPRVAGEPRYDNHCRDRGLPLVEGLGWRLALGPGEERFEDLRLGPQVQEPAAQCGDLLLRDRRGNWTYQFAVTVDDWEQRIDLVVRGVDLLPSTGRQLRLARLLGRTAPPRFLHHPLIMKSATQKLSKSDGDSGVRDLRTLGWTPAAVRAAARRAGGLPPHSERPASRAARSGT